MTKKMIALLSFVLVTSSCTLYHIDSVDTDGNLYPPTSPSDVIYLEGLDEKDDC